MKQFYKSGFFILLIILVSVALMGQGRWPWLQGKGIALQYGQRIESVHQDSLKITSPASFILHVDSINAAKIIPERIIFTEDAGRTGEGTYLFANGLPIGMATPGDCQGMKMEFDYGVTKTSFAAGRMTIGLLIKMTMDEVYLPDATPYNAVVRGLSCQAVSEDTVGGRVVGAYINAQAQAARGVAEIQGYWSGATSAGLVGLHVRTEIQSNDTIVSPAAAGIFIFHRSKATSAFSGDYRAIQINQIQLDAPGTMDGTEYGIYFTDDLGTNDAYDFIFGFDTDLDGYGTVIDSSDTAGGASDQDATGFITVQVGPSTRYIHLFSTKPSG